MTATEERLIDDLRSALSTALRILDRDVARAGKPCPDIAQVAAIRTQASQATVLASELFGYMAARADVPRQK